MNKLRLGIVAVAMLVSSAAQATSCNVKELNDIGTTVGNVRVQVAQEPAVFEQSPVTTSGTSAPSAAFGAGTKFIEFICDSQTAYLVGAGTPVALVTSFYVPAGTSKVIGVTKGHKIAFILRP